MDINRDCQHIYDCSHGDIFSVDDKGNEAIFYEKMSDGTIEPQARLYREAGTDANELTFENWAGEKLKQWANENGYESEILEATKI